MSADSFSQLFQAERRIFSSFHQGASADGPRTLSEAFENLASSGGEPVSSSADQGKRKLPGKLKATPPEERYGPIGLLDLPVHIAKDCENEVDENASELDPAVSHGRGIPFVSYVPDDLVALCSSGGGIRSAIFNLGVLQGLDKLKLLPLFDYHSTVSGGGYLGGWWSAWRAKHPDTPFPQADDNLVEHAAIRRLREKSRFLSPNGFALSAEIWRGLFLWAIGVVATLLMAFSMVGLAITAWSALRALAQWRGLTGDWTFLLVPAVLAVVSTLLSERTSGLWKARWRWFGVSLFLAMGSACALNGVWAFTALIGGKYPFLTLGSAFAIAGSSSGLIRWLAGWVAKREQNKAPNSLASLVSRYLPQLLALTVLACMAFLLVFALRITGWVASPHDFLPFLVTTSVLALVGHLAIGVPSTLHRFYRSRIEESFLRVRESDDFEVSSVQDWPDRVARPLHVVNCCASDTRYSTTDQMDRRGASVSLSAAGAYPSGQGAMPTMSCPTLSEAITASAAAVDPSMGIYSARLGRLVAFVLFAFNLRLGVWWQPNRATVPRRNSVFRHLIGRLTLRPWKEMLSQISLPVPTTDPDHKAYATSGLDFRLTDGGHFDNLAAYEMIRRRCRYVVICDGGADPGNHFAELANLQRLVRRDFGVEIEIDLDPLRVDADRKSRRHLAAGRIRYPDSSSSGQSGFHEDGVLLYVKPSLTGDEPEDLTQYQAASHTFPHETTTDQFFDDHQWEAYRKLGEHSITRDLGFVRGYLDEDRPADPKLAARLFDAAIRELGSEDHQLQTGNSIAAGRFADRLADQPDNWVDELLSELYAIDDEKDRKRARLSLLNTMSLLEGQEEAFYRCNLKRHGDHLENWGVENRADRIAGSADVRRWWPVLASLHSIPFRNYLGAKYGLNDQLPILHRNLVNLRFIRLLDHAGDSATPKSITRIERARGSEAASENDWVLHATCRLDTAEIDLGALAFNLSEDAKEIAICIDDLQVAPGYWSIGHNAILMDGLLEHFGFEVAGAVNGSKPQMSNAEAIDVLSIERVVVSKAGRDVEIVRRPEQRHSWIQRGFVQTRSGLLVRDQKKRERAGMYCGG